MKFINAKMVLISVLAGICLVGCSSNEQTKSVSKPKPKVIPKFSFQTPNIYTSTVKNKIVEVSPTARVVLFNPDNSESAAPTEQVYMVNSKTDKWQLIYKNTLTSLKSEYLSQTDTAKLGPNQYVVASMWDAGMSGSMVYDEVVVIDTKQNKALYEKDYQHRVSHKLFTLNSNQVKPIIQQSSTPLIPIPKQSVAVLGATSGNVLYLDKNKVQDVEFDNQAEVEKLTLSPNSYVTITPSSTLNSINSIQGNYEDLTYATSSSPAILTVKAGTILVFNNIKENDYSAFTNIGSQDEVSTVQADMLNDGVTPKLQPGLWTFLLAPNDSIDNQGIILQVHVTQ